MNKKLLIIILLTVIASPFVAMAVNGPKEIGTAVADIAMTIGASIVVIGWVIAGILYLMSRGDPGKTKTAKDALVAAVIGTILVIIAKGGYAVIQTFLKDVVG